MHYRYSVGESKQSHTNLADYLLSKNHWTMSKSNQELSFTVLHAHCAGVDVGSRLHWVSIGEGKEHQREFGVFTSDLHALCEWLVSEGIKRVAMESTGYYWKQLFLMVQSYGMEAILVNALYTKNIKGRKPSDKSDSEWIWKMYSVGLLPGSFQPSFFTDELRTYGRHRKRLIESASQCVNRMQKCLTLMNIQLPVILSDIMGKSGSAIIEAILGGERDSKVLADLADGRLKADKATIVKSLTGFWRSDQLFELRHHWDLYGFYKQQIQECDEQIEALLTKQVQTTGQVDLVYETDKSEKKNVRLKMHLNSTYPPTLTK